ncbi:hypothetical protein UCDDA912_g09132 [Diaporthe ampelina]|uniref:CCHC-type domain-containing protein n=1 Tax=Diaporthe ampelina TaxID=1214573 RepID=A0A0G2F9V1_9PEZI|nr:hypothetical protein UCDDA912_g09132 [Diaporthe ampelina]
MPGVLRSGNGSMMKIPEAQFYSLPPQQGSFQAFDPNNGPAQGYDQRQRNDRTFNQSNGPLMGSLPQVHRPVFDRHGYIVGEEGNIDDNYMYISNMYGNRKVGLSQPKPFQGAYERLDPPQWAQNAEMSDVQLVAAAESFLSFVKDNMGQDEDNQNENHQDEVNEYEAYQEERDQDEGVALGNTKANHNNRSTSKQAAPYQAAAPSRPPESSHGGLVRAGEREPHRFADKTGMGLCDYCGRDGHEADACIKWDPVHFDKPVCTACNNDQHSLDECPKFGAMPPRDKAALLLDKGARRPGVRGENHAWTSYVRRRGCYYREGGAGAGAGGLPLTRVFLFVLLSSRGSGAGLQDIWKVWDYGRGVPDQFRDLRAESLAGNPATPLDERFMGGEHQLSLIARAPVGTVGAATARTGAGLQPPHPREAPSVARNQNQRQRQPQSRLQAGSDGEEEDEAL